jgi:hypothetical protein
VTDYKKPYIRVNKKLTKSSNMVTLLQMPNLHSFYGLKLGDNYDFVPHENNPFLKLKPRSCPVEYIELRRSELHTDNISLLLGATIPGKLKTFNHEVGGMWFLRDVAHPVIMQCLVAHHSTLENLGLSHNDDYPYGNGDNDSPSDAPTPYSFTQFEALKRLKVSPVFVWDNRGLYNQAKYTEATRRNMLWKGPPKGIEELWLTRGEHREFLERDMPPYFIPDCLLPALESLLDHKAEGFPKLNRIIIQFSLLTWEIPWLDALALLCHRAAAMGIQDMILLAEWTCPLENNYVEWDWGWNEDVIWEHGRDTDDKPKKRPIVTEEEDLRQTLRDLKNAETEELEQYY